MAIISTELKMYKADTNDDTTSNGGTMSGTESVSGVSGNILPDVSEAIRTNGTTSELGGPRYRKVFLKNTNSEAGPLSLTNPRLYVSQETSGDDWVNFFPVTNFNEVQSAVSEPEARYGIADLATSISAGTTSTVVVTLEDANNNDIFNDGDEIRLYDSNTTNEEFATVTTAGTPSGTAQTLTCSGNIVLAFVNTTTTVSTVYEHGSALVASESIGSPSASGTLSAVTVNNIGTVEDVWTITFSSSTAFAVSGSVTGTPVDSTGTTASTFAPDNPKHPGNPYFSIASGAWGGTWANNDTIQITTSAGAMAVWISQEVPASASALTSNTFRIIIDGETA